MTTASARAAWRSSLQSAIDPSIGRAAFAVAGDRTDFATEAADESQARVFVERRGPVDAARCSAAKTRVRVESSPSSSSAACERVAGHDRERRELAARDREQAVLFPDRVLARLLRRIGSCPCRSPDGHPDHVEMMSFVR